MCLSECHCDPLHRLSITRLSPASVHLRFHGSRSRPSYDRRPAWTLPAAHRIPPQRPHTVCLPTHHTTLYRLLSALSSLSAPPPPPPLPAAPSNPTPPPPHDLRLGPGLASFIVYFLFIFISSVHTIGTVFVSVLFALRVCALSASASVSARHGWGLASSFRLLSKDYGCCILTRLYCTITGGPSSARSELGRPRWMGLYRWFTTGWRIHTY